MRVILDWDYTIFDTKKMKDDLADSLRVVDLPKKIFFDTYPLVIKYNGERYDYSYLNHVKFLSHKYHLTRQQEEKLKKEMLGVLKNGSKYLFKDTVSFLKKLKNSGAHLILCTLGNAALQRHKINSSGIKEYFSLIFITPTKKYKTLQRLLKKIPDGHIYFVSDSLDELKEVSNKFSFVRPICKIRPDKRGDVRKASVLKILAFHNFQGISNFLLQHKSTDGER